MWLRNNPRFTTKGFLYWDSVQGPSCAQEKHNHNHSNMVPAPETRFMLERKVRAHVIVKRCRVEANQRKSFAESLINRGIYSSKKCVISSKLWISTADLTKSDAFKIFQMTKVLKNYQEIVDNITIWFIYLFNQNYTCCHAKNFQKSWQKLTKSISMFSKHPIGRFLNQCGSILPRGDLFGYSHIWSRHKNWPKRN